MTYNLELPTNIPSLAVTRIICDTMIYLYHLWLQIVKVWIYPGLIQLMVTRRVIYLYWNIFVEYLKCIAFHLVEMEPNKYLHLDIIEVYNVWYCMCCIIFTWTVSRVKFASFLLHALASFQPPATCCYHVVHGNVCLHIG